MGCPWVARSIHGLRQPRVAPMVDLSSAETLTNSNSLRHWLRSRLPNMRRPARDCAFGRRQ
eukprot:758631-Pyramimonas_sp.AAC.1